MTVNIIFSGGSRRRAAEQIVKETWGGPPIHSRRDSRKASYREFRHKIRARFHGQAHAQEATSIFPTRRFARSKTSIKKRSAAIKPYRTRVTSVRSRRTLAIRSSDGLSLKERAEPSIGRGWNATAKPGRRDRPKPTASPDAGRKSSIFAKKGPIWPARLWIQDAQGNWKKK